MTSSGPRAVTSGNSRSWRATCPMRQRDDPSQLHARLIALGHVRQDVLAARVVAHLVQELGQVGAAGRGE
jgi:hypothetical protein